MSSPLCAWFDLEHQEVYRREFLDGLTGEMRDTFKARSEYLRLRGGAGVPAGA